MTTDDPVFATVLKVFAVLLVIPALGMGVVMPLMALTGGSHTAAGTGSWATLLLPAVPLVVLTGVGYALYAGMSGEGTRVANSRFGERRSAHARGSDEESESRGDGPEPSAHEPAGTEVSRRD